MFIWQRKLRYRFGLAGVQSRHTRKKDYYSYKGRRAARRLRFFAVCAAIVFGIIYLTGNIQRRINPLINDMALSNLNSIVLRECSDVVSDMVCDYGVSYESLINKDLSESGRVNSLSVDYTKLNVMKSDMASEIQTRIDQINSVDVSIPLMAFISNRFYSGIGIPISIRVLTDENVKVDFYDEFVTEGINQTKHLIKVRIIIDMGINVPVRNNGEPIETEIPIAESIIPGDVPDTYLDFN